MSPCYFRAVSLFEPPSAYGGVESCDYVSGHYLGFLWASASLCVLCCFIGIMAALATYSYRKIIKPRPTSIGISTNVTTPMLQHRTEIREIREITANWTAGSSGGSPTLDIPIPAPRNSLGRSSGRRALLALPAPEESTTPDGSSTVPPRKKKKRRAPDIPGSQPSSSVESSPSRLVATDIVVRPKRESVTRAVRSLDRRNLQDAASSSSPERRHNSLDSGQVLSSSPPRLRDRVRNSRDERPRSLCSSPQRQAQDGVRESDRQENLDLERPSASRHRSSPSRGLPSSSASGRERYRLSAAETTSQDASADSEGLPSYASCTGFSPNRSSCTGASSLRNSLSPNDSSTNTNTSSTSRASSDAASATNTPSNASSSRGASRRDTPEEVVVRKKRKSHKGPAPQPPTQQMQLQACRAPLSSLSPIPQSPPPPFSAGHPPSPPASPPPFSSSPHHSHVQQYNHPPAPQPVTNIHVTFTAPAALGPAPMSMPLNQPHGYTFQSHPSAPYL